MHKDKSDKAGGKAGPGGNMEKMFLQPVTAHGAMVRIGQSLDSLKMNMLCHRAAMHKPNRTQDRVSLRKRIYEK